MWIRQKAKPEKTPFSDNCIYWESRIFYTWLILTLVAEMVEQTTTELSFE